MMQAVDIRAADADRERVLAELQRHTSAGRLTLDEFSERAAAVYRSRAMGELAALTADLPPIPGRDPSSHAGMRIPRALWIALILVAVAVALLGLVAHAGPMMGGLGCGW